MLTSFEIVTLFFITFRTFDLSNSNEKPRDFQRKLKGNCKIHSYEPTPLIEKIITNSIQKIESLDLSDSAIGVINEMVRCLFHNYKIRKNQDAKLEVVKIPLLDSELEVCFARELVLSSEFTIGKKAAEIFKGVSIKAKYCCINQG